MHHSMTPGYMRALVPPSVQQDLDQGESEVIKMTRTFDNVPQGNAEPSHHRITECQEDYTLLKESEKESHKPVQHYHLYVGKGKIFDSSDSSVDSGYESKDSSQCQLINKEPHVKSKLGADLDIEQDDGKAVIISQGVEIENKCENYKRVRKLKCICLSISFVGNIVLILAIILLATNIRNRVKNEGENCQLQHLAKQVLQDSLCISCNNLGSHVKTQGTLFDVFSPCGVKFCCVRNEALQKFFLLMLQEGHTSEATTKRLAAVNNAEVNRTLNTWRSREIAAHLYANITSLPETLTWQTDVGFGSAFLRGVTLTQESRLMVPRAGYYFIYSAVTFKCQHSLKPHLHLINRQHRGRPNAGVQQLLLSKSSECGPDGFYTSFLAGVLKLTSNDEISVNLTEDSLSSVYASSLSNFFGIYVI